MRLLQKEIDVIEPSGRKSNLTALSVQTDESM